MAIFGDEKLILRGPTGPEDLSSSGFDGIYFGGMGVVPDVEHNGVSAFDFDGVDDYIGNIGTTSSFMFIHTTKEFSVGFWLKLKDLTTRQSFLGSTFTMIERGFTCLFERGVTGYGENALRFTASIAVPNTPSVHGTTNDNIITDTNWHHCVFVCSEDNWPSGQWYIDGVPVTTTTTRYGAGIGATRQLSTPTPSNRVLNVGRTNWMSTTTSSKNYMDDVRIFARSLTSAEVSSWYSSGRGYFDSSANRWTPTILSPNLWLDANDLSCLTTSSDPNTIISPGDGDRIGSWRDRSSGNYHFNQTSEDNRPFYSSTGMNGNGAIWFNADDPISYAQGLFAMGDYRWMFTSGDYTLYAVFYCDEAIDDRATRNAYQSIFVGEGNHQGIFVPSTNQIPDRSLSVVWSTTGAEASSGGAYSPSRTCVVGNLVNSEPGNVFVTNRTDGTINAPINVISGSLRLPSFVRIGRARIAGNTLYEWQLNGYIGEILRFPGQLTHTDCQKVEGYLAHKWGSVAYLPTDHPYKYTPPFVSFSHPRIVGPDVVGSLGPVGRPRIVGPDVVGGLG